VFLNSGAKCVASLLPRLSFRFNIGRTGWLFLYNFFLSYIYIYIYICGELRFMFVYFNSVILLWHVLMLFLTFSAVCS
jgi:hypothetical protein